MKPKRQVARQYKVPIAIERERQKDLGVYEITRSYKDRHPTESYLQGDRPKYPYDKNEVRLPIHTFDDELEDLESNQGPGD